TFRAARAPAARRSEPTRTRTPARAGSRGGHAGQRPSRPAAQAPARPARHPAAQHTVPAPPPAPHTGRASSAGSPLFARHGGGVVLVPRSSYGRWWRALPSSRADRRPLDASSQHTVPAPRGSRRGQRRRALAGARRPARVLARLAARAPRPLGAG